MSEPNATPQQSQEPQRSGAKLGEASRRRLAIQVAGSTSALLITAIILMVNYLGFRHYTRFDWTQQALFTLSPKSIEVLKGLSTDVDLYLFMSRGEPNFADTEELLKRYQATTDRLRVRYVDPVREEAEYRMLAQRYDMTAGEDQEVVAVVTAGDKRWSVKRDDMLAWDYGSVGAQDGEQMDVKAEQALTGAIVQVVSGRATKLCVTKGHGEWSLDEGSERSLDGLKNALKHDNVEWEAIETLGKTSFPTTCDAVFVLGPLGRFTEGESAALVDYLRKGGNALLALDPVIERDEIQATGLEESMRELGVRIDQTLVVETNPAQLVTQNALEFVVTAFGSHTTTTPMVDRGKVLLAMARGVDATEAGGADIVMRTSVEAYGETNIGQVQTGTEPARDSSDMAGPISLAVATRVSSAQDIAADPEGDASAKKTGGRLIVIGDSDWLQQEVLEIPVFDNDYLAGAFTGWLAERPAMIALPPKKAKVGYISFTQDDVMSVMFRVVILLPGAAFLFGVAVWLNRRA